MTVAKPGRTISVVIPTYNRCARLPAALDSICSQDVDGLEVIVVDNNSKDRTPEVVKAYPDPRVRYTLCTKQGIYHAINHGFAMATGDYLTWTSDDNLYLRVARRSDGQRVPDESGAARGTRTDLLRRPVLPLPAAGLRAGRGPRRAVPLGGGLRLLASRLPGGFRHAHHVGRALRVPVSPGF